MARPTKRTPEREARIFEALRVGNTRPTAAAYAGISERTLRYWAEQSAVFADALRAREAEAEMAATAAIWRAAKEGDWHAAAWFLEHRYPDDWGRTTRVIFINVRCGCRIDRAEAVRQAEAIVRER